MTKTTFFVLASLSFALGSTPALAEPMFLAKQYARCTTCHYSSTGGGLLTPYGRSLARQELSTLGRKFTTQQTGEEEPQEEGPLKALTGNVLGPIDIGFDTRPSHLNLDFGTASTSRNLWMNADFEAAYRHSGWTLYGELGRQPLLDGLKIGSYEYWVGHEKEGGGLGFRAGRFLPPYGVRLADHTAFTRAPLALGIYDQVYALEMSYAGERNLLQVTVGPGLASAVLDNNGRSAFTTTARLQTDLTTRSSLVLSGRFRSSSDREPRSATTGAALGVAPTSHLSIWTEGDVAFRQGSPGTQAYVLINETSVELHRGLWVKFSPQLQTFPGNARSGTLRIAVEGDLLPTPASNVGISYYWDRDRLSHFVVKTLLIQLHLYL